MNFKQLLAGTVAIIAALSSCTKDPSPDVPEGMTLEPKSLTFAAKQAEPQTVKVTSSRDWKVAAAQCPEWVLLTEGGKSIVDTQISAGVHTITVAVLDNSSFERTASIKFNGGTTVNQNLSITQAGDVTYTTIADVKAKLGTASSVVLDSGTVIKAVLVSSIDLSNQVSSSNTIVQDETAGIAIRFASANTYKFGQPLIIDLSGQTLSKYNGAFQIAGVPNANATSAGAVTAPTPKEVSVADFVANKYESMYVALKDVQVVKADTSKTWASSSSHTSIGMEAKTGESFVVFSSKYSTYASQKVSKGCGTLKGVSTINNSTIQIMFGQTSDWEGLTGERFQPTYATYTVDESLELAKGANAKVYGRVIKLVNGGFILNGGTQNNLYVYTQASTGLPTVAENDIVEVTGSIDFYGSGVELKPTEITSSTKTVPATPKLEVTALTPEQVASYTGKSASLVKISGKLVVSGSFYNVELDGQTIQGSLKLSAGVTLTAGLDGKVVDATGFFIGSTNKWFNVGITSSTDVVESANEYITVTPQTIDVAADTTATSFNIVTNSTSPWSVSFSNPDFTTTTATGTGNAKVTVNFPANTSTTDPVSCTVTVSITGSEITPATLKITQAAAQDPSETSIELTYNEIVKTLTDLGSTSSTYTSVTYKGTSGDWPSNSSPNKSNKWIQIRDTKGSYLKSPSFKKSISKIEIRTDANKGTSIRTFYAMPSDTDLSKVSDNTKSYANDVNKSILSSNYGSVTSKGITAGTAGQVGEKLTLNVKGDVKDFMLLVTFEGSTNTNGAGFINSIKVYFKSED